MRGNKRQKGLPKKRIPAGVAALALLLVLVCSQLPTVAFAETVSKNTVAGEDMSANQIKRETVSQGQAGGSQDEKRNRVPDVLSANGMKAADAGRAVTLSGRLVESVVLLYGINNDKKPITPGKDIDLAKGEEFTAVWNLAPATLKEIAQKIHGDPAFSEGSYTWRLPIPAEFEVKMKDTSREVRLEQNGPVVAHIKAEDHSGSKQVEIVFKQEMGQYASGSIGAVGYDLVVSLNAEKNNDGDVSAAFKDENNNSIGSPVTIPLMVHKTGADVDISKSSGQDASASDNIIWTITVDPKNADGCWDTDMLALTVTDTLPKGIVFDGSDPSNYSLKIGGNLLTSGSDYKIMASMVGDNQVVRCEIGNGSTSIIHTAGSAKIVLTLKTTIDYSKAEVKKYSKEQENNNQHVEGISYVFDNAAHVQEMTYKQKDGTKDSAGKAVETTVNTGDISASKKAEDTFQNDAVLIQKQAKRVGNIITWTIFINAAGLNLGDVPITDDMSALVGIELEAPVNVKLTKGSGNTDVTAMHNVQYDAAAKKITGKITGCAEAYCLTYDTKIINKDKSSTLKNVIEIGGIGPGPYKSSYTIKTGSVLSKTAIQSEANRKEDVLGYRISFNENAATIEDMVVRDYINDKLQLIDNTASPRNPVDVTLDGRNYKRYEVDGALIGDGSNTAYYTKPIHIVQSGLHGATALAPKVYYYICQDASVDTDKKHMLELNFEGHSIDDAYTVTLLPKVIDSTVWKVNTPSGQKLPNQVSAAGKIGGAPVTMSAAADPEIRHTVIGKSIKETDYDPIEHTFRWTLTINASTVRLKDARVTDTLPAGHELAEAKGIQIVQGSAGAVTMNRDDSQTAKNTYKLESGPPQEKIIFSMPDSSGKDYLDEKCTITFYSKLKDDAIASADVTVPDENHENTVELTHADASAADKPNLTTAAAVQLKDGLLNKKMDSTNVGSTNKVKWTVVINANGFRMKAPVITDDFHPRMVLDTAFGTNGVLVYKGRTPTGTPLTPGTDYTLSVPRVGDAGGIHEQLKLSFKYDIDAPYCLVYETYVTPDTENGQSCDTNVSNSVKLSNRSDAYRPVAAGGSVRYYSANAWGSFRNTAMGSLTIQKEEQGNPAVVLAGAEFEITAADGTKFTAATGADGTVKLNNLAFKDYTIKETKAPAGYLPDSVPQTVTLSNGAQQHVTVRFENEKITGALCIEKQDARDAGKLLAGAEFLVEKQGGGYSQSFTTDANGRIVIAKLQPGAYQVKETRAPAGYELSAAPQTAIITDVNAPEPVYLYFKNEKQAGKLHIKKQDAADGTPLSGAEFKITGEDGSEMTVTTGADGTATADYVSLNVLYTVTEQKAPAGYEPDFTPQTARIERIGETVALVFMNKKITEKKEPDNSGNSDDSQNSDSQNSSGAAAPPAETSVQIIPLPTAEKDPFAEAPKLQRNEVPDANAADSPAFIVLVDGQGNVLGKYTRTPNADGTFDYVNEYGEVLGAKRGVATGDNMPVIPIAAVTLFSITGIAALLYHKKKRGGYLDGK